MRILFLTRVHPDRRSSRLGRRLHERLCELSELGHEVLVFTQWRGEQIDFQFPKRIEVRFPFRTFKAWEWPQAAALALNWQPEIVHILDPGLVRADRFLSAEVSALPLLDGLRLSTRNRVRPQAIVSHLSPPAEHAKTVSFWKTLGVVATESDWLGLSFENPSFQRPFIESETPEVRTEMRRFVLAGVPSERPDFLESLKHAIDFLQASKGIELTAFCDRTRFSRQERAQLQAWERSASDFENPTAAAAARIHLEMPEKSLECLEMGAFDGAIVAGLETRSLKAWAEVLPMPLVGSEGQYDIVATDARIMGLVPDVAWMPQALACLGNDSTRNRIWSDLASGALEAKRDIAVNRISRLYSQVLAHPPTPSYS